MRCDMCGSFVHPIKNFLQNVPPDGATMQEWVCEVGHVVFVEVAL